VKVAIVALDGGKFARPVAREVFQLDNSSTRPTRLDNRGRRLAAIETFGAFSSDQAQRVCKLALHQSFAGREGLPLGEEDFRSRWKFSEIIRRGAEHVDVALVEDEAIL